MQRREGNVIERQGARQVSGEEAIGRQVKIRVAGGGGNRLSHCCPERDTPAATKLKQKARLSLFIGDE